MFVATSIRMLRATCRIYRLKMLAVPSAVATENNDDITGILTRPPEPIALMIADGFRQSIFRTKEIYRASFSVIVRENGRPRTLVRGKRIVNCRDFARHLFPAEFVCEVLRKRPGRLVLRAD